MGEFVRTVTGDVAPDTLGHCQCHEHIFLEMDRSYEVSPVLYMDDYDKSLAELREYRAAGGGTIVDAQPVLCLLYTSIEGLWHPLAYINGGGLCIRWFRDEFTGKPAASYDDLMAEAENLPAGSEGILFVPHFCGRVLPNNPYVKGSFVGLDWKHGRGHLYLSLIHI